MVTDVCHYTAERILFSNEPTSFQCSTKNEILKDVFLIIIDIIFTAFLLILINYNYLDIIIRIFVIFLVFILQVLLFICRVLFLAQNISRGFSYFLELVTNVL